MIRKLTLGTIAAAVLAIGVLGVTNLGTSADYAEAVDIKTSEDISNSDASYLAFADKPKNRIIPIEVDPDYGDTSSFDIDKVKCKVYKKHGQMNVDWCKATATMNKVDLLELIDMGPDSIEDFEALINAISANPTDFDKIIVDYETALLTIEIQNHLDTLDPPITLPDDYKSKSVAMKWTVQNDGGVETSQTKLVMKINYTDDRKDKHGDWWK